MWTVGILADYKDASCDSNHRQARSSRPASSDADEGAQMLVYEDNFGFKDIGEPKERAFFGPHSAKVY
jgi:hypothetical protein